GGGRPGGGVSGWGWGTGWGWGSGGGEWGRGWGPGSAVFPRSTPCLRSPMPSATPCEPHEERGCEDRARGHGVAGYPYQEVGHVLAASQGGGGAVHQEGGGDGAGDQALDDPAPHELPASCTRVGAQCRICLTMASACGGSPGGVCVRGEELPAAQCAPDALAGERVEVVGRIAHECRSGRPGASRVG